MTPLRPGSGRCILLLACVLACLGVPHAGAQLPVITTGQGPTAQTPTETPPTMFPHSGTSRYWISGQTNVIFQANPQFHADYSGPNSFQNRYSSATGSVSTLYTGIQFGDSTEVLVDGELATGLGLSSTLGLGGFTDLDAVRDPKLNPTPYLSRAMVHHVFALTREKDEADRGPLSTFSELPKKRIEVRIGKFGMTDFFDTNAVGGDTHLQFMNYAIDQNGAYDFTADARGYTWGIAGEFQSRRWGLRSALALMPGPQNGGPLVWDLRKANTSDTEFEWHHGPVPSKLPGIIRVLGWVNHANMGVYQYAIDQYLAGKTPTPDISAHPRQVTAKYGFGLNIEQNVTAAITVYGRFGWDNGKTETWSFTEVDQTVSSGVVFPGQLWKRSYDRAGAAFASNGISSVHARYLGLGGLGFELGDGGLRYGRENLAESFYTAHLWRGIFCGPDLQYIVNPGYNQARGPVLVPSLRMHVEF